MRRALAPLCSLILACGPDVATTGTDSDTGPDLEPCEQRRHPGDFGPTELADADLVATVTHIDGELFVKEVTGPDVLRFECLEQTGGLPGEGVESHIVS